MKALKDKVQPIRKEYIRDTIEHFCQMADIYERSIVGSAGAVVNVVNDIDLAVRSEQYTLEVIHNRLINILGEENCVINLGTKIGSYAVPIGGGKGGGIYGKVQVDLMFVSNLDWAEFIYYSPGNRSRYKGSVRAILLSAVAASICDVSRDFFSYDNSELIARAGWTIDPNVGMKRIFQIRPNKIHGSGYVKQMKNITPEELQELYPRNTFDHQQYVISDPRRVTELLFGWGTTPNHTDTAEKIIKLIKKRHTVAWHEHIFRIAQKRASQLDTPLPPELDY